MYIDVYVIYEQQPGARREPPQLGQELAAAGEDRSAGLRSARVGRETSEQHK